jgi:hypothetical protein
MLDTCLSKFWQKAFDLCNDNTKFIEAYGILLYKSERVHRIQITNDRSQTFIPSKLQSKLNS